MDMEAFRAVVFAVLLTFIKCQDHTGNGDCFISDVSNVHWSTRFILNISDTDTGVIFRRSSVNITGVKNIEFLGCELVSPPYVDASVVNDEVVIQLLPKFRNYEMLETSPSMTVVVDFNCLNGVRSLTIVYNIRDTNNHAPAFMPWSSGSNYTFEVTLPLTKGFPISSVYGEVWVKDDDLTNFAIIPQIQPNDNFDVQYKQINNTKKLYQIIVLTKKEIKSLTEPITLLMTAADVDKTGYPSFVTAILFTVKSNGTYLQTNKSDFEYSSYQGVYDNSNNVINFDKKISIVEGYDSKIEYLLDESGSRYFEVYKNGSFAVIVSNGSPIPENVIFDPKLFVMTLSAILENTTVARTDIIIHFVKEPDCKILEYNDTVWNNGLNVHISDKFSGVSLKIFMQNTIRITDYYDELNDGPYVIPLMTNDQVNLTVIDKLGESYEINESYDNFTLFIDFKCRRGSRTLPIKYNIKDTNNHSPELVTFNVFNIFTPIPSNFSLTRYYGDIIIRDVDLTNYNINASLQTNSYVELSYEGRQGKNYKFSLTTKVLILDLQEPISLTLTATDVDLTSEPPLTSNGTVVIRSP